MKVLDLKESIAQLKNSQSPMQQFLLCLGTILAELLIIIFFKLNVILLSPQAQLIHRLVILLTKLRSITWASIATKSSKKNNFKNLTKFSAKKAIKTFSIAAWKGSWFVSENVSKVELQSNRRVDSNSKIWWTESRYLNMTEAMWIIEF